MNLNELAEPRPVPLQKAAWAERGSVIQDDR